MLKFPALSLFIYRAKPVTEMERSGIEVARINSQNNLFFAEFFLSIFSFVIYNEVGVGFSTFNTECPSFEAWDSGHIKEC